MVSEPHDWTVPAPLRALLWWPPLAFLVVLLEPTAAAGTIALTGAVLAVLGVAGSAVGQAITRRREPDADDDPTGTVTAGTDLAVPLAVEQRAA
jgi:hypothetical protein